MNPMLYTPTKETKLYTAEQLKLDRNIEAINDAASEMGDCRKATAIQVARLKAANEMIRQAAAMLRGELSVSY